MANIFTRHTPACQLIIKWILTLWTAKRFLRIKNLKIFWAESCVLLVISSSLGFIAENRVVKSPIFPGPWPFLAVQKNTISEKYLLIFFSKKKKWKKIIWFFLEKFFSSPKIPKMKRIQWMKLKNLIFYFQRSSNWSFFENEIWYYSNIFYWGRAGKFYWHGVQEIP